MSATLESSHLTAVVDQLTALIRDNGQNVNQLVDERFAALLTQIAPQLKATLATESKAQLGKLQQAANAVVAAVRTAEATLADSVKLQVVRTLEELAPRKIQIIDKAGLPVATITDHVRPEFDEILQCASIGLNILLVGKAGTGKSMLGEQIAKALGLRFGFLCCSGGVSESRLIGRIGAQGYIGTEFLEIYENGGVFVLEEVDGAEANMLLAINVALSNGHIDTPNPAKPTIKRHKDCIILACANTYGSGADRQYVGRNQLDAATLDRFAGSTFEIDYDRKFESKAGHPEVVAWVHELRDAIDRHKIRRIASTRLVLNASKRMAIGHTLEQIKRSFFLSWTEAERRLVGE